MSGTGDQPEGCKQKNPGNRRNRGAPLSLGPPQGGRWDSALWRWARFAGFGAVVFRAMIGGFHNLLFLGMWSFGYDANVHTLPSSWAPGFLVPIIGSIGVAFLVTTFAPEAKGRSVGCDPRNPQASNRRTYASPSPQRE
jgi:hypothetical protein